MQRPSEGSGRVGNPVLGLYLNAPGRRDLLKALALHYAVIIAIGAIVWPFVTGDESPNYDIITKSVGTYCFLVATIILPLLSPLLFPAVEDLDPAIMLTRLDRLAAANARMISTVGLSAGAVLPLLPLLFIADRVLGNPTDFYDIFPALQAVATAAWVNLIMDVTDFAESQYGRMSRRLSVIAAFVLLHIWLVGFVSRTSFVTLQNFQVLKLLVDLNPFSQLYILMEGASQQRLLINSAIQRLVDFRLYMFSIQALVLALSLLIYRAKLLSKEPPA
jgi:hypothetical protein